MSWLMATGPRQRLDPRHDREAVSVRVAITEGYRQHLPGSRHRVSRCRLKVRARYRLLLKTGRAAERHTSPVASTTCPVTGWWRSIPALMTSSRSNHVIALSP